MLAYKSLFRIFLFKFFHSACFEPFSASFFCHRSSRSPLRSSRKQKNTLENSPQNKAEQNLKQALSKTCLQSYVSFLNGSRLWAIKRRNGLQGVSAAALPRGCAGAPQAGKGGDARARKDGGRMTSARLRMPLCRQQGSSHCTMQTASPHVAFSAPVRSLLRSRTQPARSASGVGCVYSIDIQDIAK